MTENKKKLNVCDKNSVLSTPWSDYLKALPAFEILIIVKFHIYDI